jgi:hypothetical protein
MIISGGRAGLPSTGIASGRHEVTAHHISGFTVHDVSLAVFVTQVGDSCNVGVEWDPDNPPTADGSLAPLGQPDYSTCQQYADQWGKQVSEHSVTIAAPGGESDQDSPDTTDTSTVEAADSGTPAAADSGAS